MITITFDEMKEAGCESACTYCRKLLKEGADPSQSMEVWRGGMKCLLISSLEEAALLEPNEGNFRLYKARRRGPEPRTDVSTDTPLPL